MARLVRLWPALALSVGLTVLGGALVTSAGPAEYVTGPTARFLFGNLSFLFGSYQLTGVRCGAELCNVNGSLWTLPWEVRCYALLVLLSALGLARPQLMARIILPATLAGVLLWDVPLVQSGAAALLGDGAVYLIGMFDRLWALFALGIAAYIFRDRIRLSWLVLGLLFLVNLAAHWVGFGLHVRALFVGYAVLCFGLLSARGGAVSGNWPDYSYGMYIFAFPLMIVIQQMLQLDSHLLLALLNLAATVPLAAFSWHVVEKPALDAFRGTHNRAVPQTLLQP
jgi:peptidoglycan/LPS O-acetylase OafA/YrhL